tara:strand:+ start:296 stop:1234 length:939 start_codon:yes stop_codon:yes gene_type:complete
MANEVTFTGLAVSGGRVSSVLSSLLMETLHDPTDLRAVMTEVPWASIGSDTMSVTLDAAPGAFSAATSEISHGTAADNAAYTTSKFSLQVARYVRAYQVSDLFGVSGGPIDLDAVVKTLADGVGLTMTDLLCSLFNSVASSVGATTVDLSTDTIYDAAFQLNSNAVVATADAPLTCVLSPVGMNDFRQSLRSEAGAIQYTDASAAALATRGPGFQGTWNGIEFWQSDSCPLINAAADRSQAMFGKGAFAYTMAPVSALQGHIPAANILMDAGAVLVELSRDADNGLSKAISTIFPAVSEAEDLRACEIVSDA